MKKFIAGLTIIALMPMSTVAQKIIAVSATERRWSGGIAGHSGSNTDIVIKSGSKIFIDSLYYKGQGTNMWGYRLNSPCSGQWNLKADSLHHTYYISQNISNYVPFEHDMESGPIGNVKKVKDTVTVKCNNVIPASSGSRQFQGIVLVTYFYKGQKQSAVIREIKELPAISYP